jgi:hypothetical protein
LELQAPELPTLTRGESFVDDEEILSAKFVPFKRQQVKKESNVELILIA